MDAPQRCAFAGYHPLVNYLFFAYVLLAPLLLMHPAFLASSFAAALAWSFHLRGRSALPFNLGFVLPLMAVAALFNPAFSHRGVTILFYIGYNPVTLESVLYGICAALMIGSVILWFSCYNAMMSSDKLIYMFGRVAPALSLIVAMALRLIPRYKAQAARIASARRNIGFDVASGGWLARVRSGGEVLSVMVTWALENGIETADSMRSRGYGLPGRTAYSNYRFDRRDSMAVAAMMVLMAMVVSAGLSAKVGVVFYPQFALVDAQPFAALALLAHAALCLLPLALDLREAVLWRSYRSKI